MELYYLAWGQLVGPPGLDQLVGPTIGSIFLDRGSKSTVVGGARGGAASCCAYINTHHIICPQLPRSGHILPSLFLSKGSRWLGDFNNWADLGVLWALASFSNEMVPSVLVF